jgi:spermidine synthase
MIMHKVQELVFGRVIERRQSKVSGTLEVWIQYGKYVLHSPEANSSFDTLHKAFKLAFRQVGVKSKKIRNALILGFGAGSVAHLLRNELKFEAPITGVELDPEVIDIARKYFELEKYDNLSLENEDAFEYVRRCNELFDFVVSDVFVDKTIPDKFLHEDYIIELSRLTQQGGMGIMNIIVETKQMKRKLNKLVSCFEKQKMKTEILNVSHNNRMVVWTYK